MRWDGARERRLDHPDMVPEKLDSSLLPTGMELENAAAVSFESWTAASLLSCSVFYHQRYLV